MSATEARVHFGELIRAVAETGEEVTIERNGRPVAAVISHQELMRLRGERSEDWRVLVQRSRDAFAPLRERGWMPEWTELINAGREERDRQLMENLRRR
jgi:prevent-host-death family protein